MKTFARLILTNGQFDRIMSIRIKLKGQALTIIMLIAHSALANKTRITRRTAGIIFIGMQLLIPSPLRRGFLQSVVNCQ